MSTANILSANGENISKCGELIRKGKLVAFPTETVYGLGANALDFDSVLKIYETKQRPLTDPVIVHVANIESSFDLINPSEKERKIYEYLASEFWPGPLTLVMKKSDRIHIDMTAKTGYVGIRIPDHEIALNLIRSSGCPIAAPSANMFNHVSPTTAIHVFNDFFDKDVTILDEGNSTLGIESTVLKITETQLLIFRLGSLPKSKIEEVLKKSNLTENLEIIVVKKVIKENENAISPGQFIKHYAPKIESFILKKKIEISEFCNKNNDQIIKKTSGNAKNYEKMGDDQWRMKCKQNEFCCGNNKTENKLTGDDSVKKGREIKMENNVNENNCQTKEIDQINELKKCDDKSADLENSKMETNNSLKLSDFNLKQCILLDFGNIHFSLSHKMKAYYSLSDEFSLSEAMFKLYWTLREAENIPDCDAIFVVDLRENEDQVKSGLEYIDCVYDKIYRACSGCFVVDNLS